VTASRQGSPAERIAERVRGIDREALEEELDARGHARVPGLLSAADCDALIRLYARRERFRSFVDLARHRFGDRGDYRYFAHPLPPLVRSLRRQLYPPLAAVANRWQERLGQAERLPARLAPFLARCAAHGQRRPTPLLLRYEREGYNCLHQDLYGSVAFPLQAAILLSRPGRDFEGGEFLLTEQRPRMQSRGEAVALRRGEAVVFPNRERPVRGSRGFYRVQVRHGVSRLHAGERYTLGIIFHDAR
jgi:hypothetical protein